MFSTCNEMHLVAMMSEPQRKQLYGTKKRTPDRKMTVPPLANKHEAEMELIRGKIRMFKARNLQT